MNDGEILGKFPRNKVANVVQKLQKNVCENPRKLVEILKKVAETMSNII